MADPWPDIRKPLRAGWRGAAPDGVRVTAMDAGPAKRRLDSSAEPATESFQFKLSDDDAALLDAHYAGNKALRFDFPHPVWGDVEACYAGAPAWSEQGRWRIADVRLEIYR